MIFSGTWPLQALAGIQSCMRNTCKAWRQGCNLIHDLSGCQLWLRITHAVHDIDKDIGIKTCISSQVNCFTDSLYTTLGVGECTFFFCVAYARKDNISISCSFCHEQILNNQEFKAGQSLLYMMGIRICNDRILAKDIQTFDLSFDSCRKHFCCFQTSFVVQLNTPCFFEFFHDSRIFYVLVAREFLRQCTHIAGTLDVVLTTKRVHATARSSEFANHHSHVGHAHNAFSTS